MTLGDVPGIVALAQAQGRNVLAGDYERFLELEGARGWVLVKEDVLVGAATGMRYFDHGFVGPVLLREGPDSSGLAVALLTQLIEVLLKDGAPRIHAEAAKLEEAILGRMGFDTVSETVIMERPASATRAAGGSRPMEARDLLDIGVLDAQVAGYGRKEYLDLLRRAFPEGARVVEVDGEVVGYVLLRRASRGWQLGPLVTRPGDEASARTLLRDALASTDEAVVTLAPRGASLALLESEGFARVGSLAHMRAGEKPDELEAPEATQWASGGRITG